MPFTFNILSFYNIGMLVTKIAFIIVGVIFFVLGVAGLILPIIPQIPFFILSIFFLCMGSKRFKKMFVGTKIYQNHLKKHLPKGGKIRTFLES